MSATKESRAGKRKGVLRAFLDFFVLFSGVSTASNLARTQGRPLKTKGLFLLRSPQREGAEDGKNSQKTARNS
jgi:hypothetical protein